MNPKDPGDLQALRVICFLKRNAVFLRWHFRMYRKSDSDVILHI